MEFTLFFGKVDYNGNRRRDSAVEVEVSLKECPRQPGRLTTDLEPADDYMTLSITGDVWMPKHFDIYYGGQCYDALLELLPNNSFLREVVEVWERWHLNDLTAGTDLQNAALAEYRGENPEWAYGYREACELLGAVGLYRDRGYRYGTKWLVELLPDEIVRQVERWYKEAN